MFQGIIGDEKYTFELCENDNYNFYEKEEERINSLFISNVNFIDLEHTFTTCFNKSKIK